MAYESPAAIIAVAVLTIVDVQLLDFIITSISSRLVGRTEATPYTCSGRRRVIYPGENVGSAAYRVRVLLLFNFFFFFYLTSRSK